MNEEEFLTEEEIEMEEFIHKQIKKNARKEFPTSQYPEKIHKTKRDYVRKPKHKNKGWD